MPRTKDYRNPWDQQRRESGRAYSAFQAYLELRPAVRSIDNAHWSAQQKRVKSTATEEPKSDDLVALRPRRFIEQFFQDQREMKRPTVRAPRHWFTWSKRYKWPERAEAWDAHCSGIVRSRYELCLKALGVERGLLEIEEFERLVRRVRKADSVLDAADKAPITDTEIEQVIDGVRRTIKRKGINFAGYASLMKEARESANRAILGPREDAPDTSKPNPPFVVACRDEPVRKIVWERPDGTVG